MKKIAGKLKLELAQFDELEAFSQFASDLDQATQNQLARGQRLRELLKQPQSSPLGLEDQVISIYAGTNGYLDKIQVPDVRDFLVGLRKYIASSKPAFGDMVRSTSEFSGDAEAILKAAIPEYIEEFLAAAK